MGTLGTTMVTMLDIMRGLDPNGREAACVEMLAEVNAMIDDIPMIACNDGTSHKVIHRTGLPTATYVRINEGVPLSKGAKSALTFRTAMLEEMSNVDSRFKSLTQTFEQFRASEDKATLEAMAQSFQYQLIYGSEDTSPEKFTGLASYYTAPSTTKTESNYNCIDGAGAGGDNTSIYLVCWGADTIFGIYPAGSKAGFDMQDMGLQRVLDDSSYPYYVYETYFKWYHGLAIKNWKYGVRIANLDVSDLKTAGTSSDSSANLLKLMSTAIYRVPSLQGVIPRFYCNRTVMEALDYQLTNHPNVQLQYKDLMNGFGITVPTLTYRGIPVRLCDQILDSEAHAT